MLCSAVFAWCSNCPYDINPDQLDSDKDGFGDVYVPSLCIFVLWVGVLGGYSTQAFESLLRVHSVP